MRCAAAVLFFCAVFVFFGPTDGTQRLIKRPHRVPRSKHSGPKMTEVKAKFPEVTFEQVKAVLEDEDKGVVVDVREKRELREDGSIPGFINIPLGEVETAFEKDPDEFKRLYHTKKPDPAKDVIFSCRSGRRALMAAEKLQELGTYHSIKVYPGSFQDWVLNGGDFHQVPLP
uniref:Putative secreted salivary gland peptide ixodes scapularis secreted salivary gland peptide n=1 Tax=Amblyomma cajennense TaxID=34607 RepID=A0A023FCS6_AMBCJ